MSEQSQSASLIKHSFHFDLQHVDPAGQYTLQIGLRDYALKRHDADSIMRTRTNQTFYRFIPDDRLTHYADDLELQADLVALMTVTKKVEVEGQQLDLPVAMSVHIPETSFRMMQHAAANQAANGFAHPKLEQYGVDPKRLAAVNEPPLHPAQLLVQAFSFKEARETAIALLYQHPGLLHLDGNSEYPAWVHEHLLNQNPYLQDLALAIYKLKENWSEWKKVLDENGEPYKDPDDESKFLYTRTLHPAVKAAMNGPLSWALKKAQDAKQLEGQMWETQYGVASDSYDAEAEHPSRIEPKPLQAGDGKKASVRWGVKGPKTSWGISVGDPVLKDNRVLNVTGYNRLARHLSAYVEFLNPNGERIDLTQEQWNEVLNSTLRSILPAKFFETFEPRKETRFVGTVGPVTTVCGVPIGMLIPDPTHFTLPVLDDRIATVRILWGGLGFNISDALNDPEIRCALVGALLTIIVDIIVPIAVFIIGSSSITNKIIKEIMKDEKTLGDIILLGMMFISGKILYDLSNDRNIINAVAPWIGMLLPKLLITKLGPYLLEKMGESALGKLLGRVLPGADLALTIFNGLTTAAQLLETTVACLSTQSVYKTDFTRTIDLKINLMPDPSTHKFPDLATSYKIAVMYDTNVTTPAVEQKYDLTGPTRSDPFSVTFKDVPAAGKLKVLVFFYAKNGWLAGQGESGWMKAQGTDGTLLTTGIQIKTHTVPLTVDSIYEHKQKIAYRDGKPAWEATASAPKQTIKNSSADPEHAIDVQNGHITTAQQPAMVGYGWKATGLHLPVDRPDGPVTDQAMYTVQNLSTLQEPSRSHWHPEVGFSQPSGIVYDVASAEDGAGRNFYIDSSNGTYDGVENRRGGFHLRKLSLKHDQKPQTDGAQSWGRFIGSLDRFVVHPQGYVIGINYTINKLEILQLPDAPSDDEQATFAVPASGEGFREGLINGPRGIGCSLDGRILILESINNRVQSFDIHGNPVKSFGAESKERSWFPLVDSASKTNYLDLAIEAKGYIYVLSYTGDGADPNDYHLDIYTPDGAFLVRTKGIAASKITVDLIRNVFTLNYETIHAPSGRPEPSVSLWIPPAPSQS